MWAVNDDQPYKAVRLGDLKGRRIARFRDPCQTTTRKNADCAIIMTEWDKFKDLEQGFAKHMKRSMVVDSRRIYNPSDMKRLVVLKGTPLRYAEQTLNPI